MTDKNANNKRKKKIKDTNIKTKTIERNEKLKCLNMFVIHLGKS